MLGSLFGLGTSALGPHVRIQGIELLLKRFRACMQGRSQDCKVRGLRDAKQVLLAAFLWRAAGKAPAN